MPKCSPMVLQRIGMLAGRVGFADVRKGMSPQMHQQMHLSGGNVRADCSIWDGSIVNELPLVLAGADGGMVQFGNFLQKERVIGEVFAEPLKLFAGSSRVVVAQIVKSQQNPGKRHKKAATISNQRQLFYTLFLIAFESAKAQHPADRSS